jgi:hypothetical protein
MRFRILSFFFSSRLRGVLWVLVLGVLMFLMTEVRFHIYGHFEGVFLLKRGGGVEIKDDLMFGDEERLIFALDAEPFYRFIHGSISHAGDGNYLDHEWYTSDGSGHIMSHFSDGTKLLTCFSRSTLSEDMGTKGLFVGGRVPPDWMGDDGISLNETGMSYFDGKKWNHLWCNVNESISPLANSTHFIYPSRWRFLGSKVKKATDKELILTSSHEVDMDGLPFRVDRCAFFKARARYFTLVIKITNIGTTSGGYFYVYGDEPWVGDYGSSAGNVGWINKRLFPYEGKVDLSRYSWAGYFDYGNDAAGESHAFSGVANFIEWQGEVRPAVVYFSNTIGRYAGEKEKVPLRSPDNRVLFLEWGPRLLAPGESDTIILAIGMADSDSKTGFPVKPDTTFNVAAYDFLGKPGF